MHVKNHTTLMTKKHFLIRRTWPRVVFVPPRTLLVRFCRAQQKPRPLGTHPFLFATSGDSPHPPPKRRNLTVSLLLFFFCFLAFINALPKIYQPSIVHPTADVRGGPLSHFTCCNLFLRTTIKATMNDISYSVIRSNHEKQKSFGRKLTPPSSVSLSLRHK